MPSSGGDDEAPYLKLQTSDLKYVCDYTHLSMSDVLQIDCITFLILLRDAFIHKLSATKDGREWLEECWILKQTSPDRKRLHKKFKGD